MFVDAVCAAQNFTDSPVHDQDFPVLSDHDVVWFEIAMDHAFFVGKMHGLANFDEHVDQTMKPPTAVRLLPARFIDGLMHLLNEFREWLAANDLHGEVDGVVWHHANFVNGYDVGVLQFAHHLASSMKRDKIPV